MNTLLASLMSLLLILVITPSTSWSATDDEAIEQAEIESTDVKDRPEWSTSVKEKYALTDAQIQSMQDKGFKGPQLAMVAGLASKSGKTIDEVMKMRTEDKMGWGKIAKQLGVHPGEIGQSVSGIRHEMRDEHKANRAEAKSAKLEKKAEKQQKRLEKRMQKQNKKSDHHGHSH